MRPYSSVHGIKVSVVRCSDRWVWRSIGATVAGVSIYGLASAWMAFSPEPSSPAKPNLGALRVVEDARLVPEFTLWGAGPPMDLQWRVVAMPVEEEEPELVLMPPAEPPRKPARSKARPAKPVEPPSDWRYEFVYNRQDR